MTTNKQTHTPGPWRVTLGTEYTITGANERIVMLLGDNRRAIPMGHDARIICAAPEMLKALRLVVKADEFQGENSDKAMMRISAMDAVYATIAAATGETV